MPPLAVFTERLRVAQRVVIEFAPDFAGIATKSEVLFGRNRTSLVKVRRRGRAHAEQAFSMLITSFVK